MHDNDVQLIECCVWWNGTLRDIDPSRRLGSDHSHVYFNQTKFWDWCGENKNSEKLRARERERGRANERQRWIDKRFL